MSTDRAALEKAIKDVAAMCCGYEWASWYSAVQALLPAARAHLETLPKTIEVYHVEFVAGCEKAPSVHVCADKVIAEARALSFRERGHRCVRVTGPHLHEVPST